MLATTGTAPAMDDVPPRWATELKWDGCRGIIAVDGVSCRILSRGGNDLSEAFPDVAGALIEAAAGRTLVLDSEIVTPDPLTGGAPAFARLQRRLHVRHPSPVLVAEVPAQAVVFDLLYSGGVDVMAAPYTRRREQLAALDLSAPRVAVPPHWTGIPLERMLQAAAEHSIEGLMLKRLDSIYIPGTRSRSWIKRPIRRNMDIVVIGMLPSRSQSGRVFGSLLMGAYDAQDALVYLGAVGSGISERERRTLAKRLDRLRIEHCPLDVPPSRSVATAAQWVRPELVGEVQFREILPGGGLRHPVWRGLVDRIAIEVRVSALG